LTTNEPYKPLTRGFRRGSGHNKAGRITVRHKGGGHKRRLRQIDFRYNKIGLPARLESIEYDPNRSGFIALALYADGERRYVLAPAGLKVGSTFLVGPEAEVKPGNRLPLSKLPVGTFIYNIELQPGSGAKLVRSAGNFAEVLSTDAGYTTVKLPSSEVRKILSACYASVGQVSNDEHQLENLGKAGRARWKGIRPTVRGSAMNPVDHPHGGGEGRQGIGLRRGPKTREGKLAFGVKTRRAKKYSDVFRVSRRIKKPRR
jgi:large subunit ribosomal protein L2